VGECWKGREEGSRVRVHVLLNKNKKPAGGWQELQERCG
jgi:hypothetical protein